MTLIAVSKTFPPEAVNEAVAAGVLDVGENYVQEFVQKREHIDPRARLHFIGHLQSNKAKFVVGKVELIQSVDRLSLARELSRLAQREGVRQRVLLEVNAGGEASKSAPPLSRQTSWPTNRPAARPGAGGADVHSSPCRQPGADRAVF